MAPAPAATVAPAATPTPAPAQGIASITWRSFLQDGVREFEIYRADRREGPWERVNSPDELFLGRAFLDAMEGDEPVSYTFTDRTVVPGRSYWYYIGKVDLAGRRSRYTRTPLHVVARDANAPVPVATATPAPPRVAPPPPDPTRLPPTPTPAPTQAPAAPTPTPIPTFTAPADSPLPTF